MNHVATLLIIVAIGRFQLIQCQDQGQEKKLHPPLLLIPEDKGYILATNIIKVNGEPAAAIENNVDDVISQFCPADDTVRGLPGEDRYLKSALSRYAEDAPKKRVPIDSDVCESPVQAELFSVKGDKRSKLATARNLEEFCIGYANFSVAEIIKLRFDRKTYTVSVSHVIASPKLLKTSDSSTIDPENYDSNWDMYLEHIDNFYSEENQKKVFAKRGLEELRDYFEYPAKSLVKRQLAPAGDFLLPIWREATYMDANTAPMWSTLTPTWQLIEISVRNIARDLDALEIETGVAEFYEIPHSDDSQTPSTVYLIMDQKMGIPGIFWKLVTHKIITGPGTSEYASILIIMPNYPIASETPQKLCTDICAQAGWFVNYDGYEKGLFYCCEVTDEIIQRLRIHSENASNKILNTSATNRATGQVIRRNIIKNQIDLIDQYPLTTSNSSNKYTAEARSTTVA